MHDLIVENARLYPMAGDALCAEATSFAVRDGHISAIPAQGEARERIDARGRVVLPGFIDCHTHALYAGDRMAEHAQRLAGATYADIARAGGGIATTVRAVRAASEAQLIDETLPRLEALAREGVTTVEIKTGYGLDTDTELKMLAAIDGLSAHTRQRIVPTFLGAHTIPPDSTREDYVATLLEEMLPAVAASRISDCCDIYIESIAFDLRDARRILARACELGLQCRAHAEQLSNIGATRLAASFGALSCDHLEHARAPEVEALALAGTTAVLLPGAFYFLRDIHKPPVEECRRQGVPMAVATDLNPGTSPIASLLTAMHFATTLFALQADEALLGVTAHAARAIGRAGVAGTLEAGKVADFSIWDIPAPAFLVYRLGGVAPDAVYVAGERL